jgi:hypothetical protein
MNPVIAYPQRGPMTQGTIFTCALAGDYVGCSTSGLILTARCDIAHEKARVLNYIPVVSLDDWLHRDGRVILAQRLLAECVGGMRSTLKDGGFSPAILEAESPRAILETLFPDNGGRKLRERFEKLCLRFELASQCLNSAPSDKLSISVGNDVPKARESYCRNLFTTT